MAETSSWVQLNVEDGTEMRAFRAVPKTATGRGLMLFQEAFGVNHHIRALTERFGDAGYYTIAPELFHRTAPGFEGDYEDFGAVQAHYKALTPQGLEHDARAAYQFLRSSGFEPAQIAAVGFCLGGRVAALANVSLKLAAAASFYGGDLLSLRPRFGSMGAPQLLVWGDQDTHIPPGQRTEVVNGLREAGKTFVDVTFSDAGHGFFCDERKSYHAASARPAWSLLLTFLEEGMGRTY